MGVSLSVVRPWQWLGLTQCSGDCASRSVGSLLLLSVHRQSDTSALPTDPTAPLAAGRYALSAAEHLSSLRHLASFGALVRLIIVFHSSTDVSAVLTTPTATRIHLLAAIARVFLTAILRVRVPSSHRPSMPSRLFLVTGATGSTGVPTVKQLLARGHRVRAFVHKEDARSAALHELGAEVVSGDLLDLDAVRAAMEGVSSAYFCYTAFYSGLSQATAIFAQAAKEANVTSIVNMSQNTAKRDASSKGAREHWLAERILDWSGVTVTHIRPCYFAEWTLYFKPMVQAGTVRLPFGPTGRHAAPAAEDQARVIVQLLEQPTIYAGQTLELYGPEELTMEEQFAAVAQATGRPIKYEHGSYDEYADLWRSFGCNEFLVQHLVETAKYQQRGDMRGTNDTIERITGQKPLTALQFATINREAFLSPISTAQ